MTSIYLRVARIRVVRQQIEKLSQQYEAAGVQAVSMLAAVDQQKLYQQQQTIEQQIERLESELGELEASTPRSADGVPLPAPISERHAEIAAQLRDERTRTGIVTALS